MFRFQLDKINFGIISKMRNSFFIFLLMFFLKFDCRVNIPFTSFPYTDTIPANSNGMQFQVDLTGLAVDGDDLNFAFQVTNSSMLTCTFLAISAVQTRFKAGGLDVTYFYGKNYSQLEGFIDLVSMQRGKKQFINRQKISLQNIIYLTVYNLDPPSRKVNIQFKITLGIQTGAGYHLDCFSCNSGQRRYDYSCICKNCAPGFYGPDCSINMLSMTSGQASIVFVNGPGMAFFKITQSNEVNILVKQASGQGEIYFQFIQTDGQFASYTNVAQGRNVQGRFISTAGTSGTSISATSTGTPMSITVAVYNNINTMFQVSYTIPQKSSILVIVLAVLGGVLFIGLLIAAIYIVRNSNYFHSSREVRPLRPINQNLSDDEIERFFPTVLLTNVQKPKGETSMQQLNENMKRQPVQDCVICLCPVQPNQEVKVTYCRHIFHAHCLIGWFRKQQNCPYCRQEFIKSNTVKLYKRLKQSSNNAVMKREQLVEAILNSRSSAIASKQSLQNLVQKQTQKIQVVPSRNSFQISNINS